MGNLLYCCRKVSDFIHGNAVEDQTEGRSPLLSSENSDIESLSPSRTVCDPLASPILDQDHLLFPDIVLSSNIAAEDLDLLLATRRQAQDVKREESNQNGGEGGVVGQPSTKVIHRDFTEMGANQLCITEDEWPLLSPLYRIPTDQPSAKNRICTYRQETDATLIRAAGSKVRYGLMCMDSSTLDTSQYDISQIAGDTEQLIRCEEQDVRVLAKTTGGKGVNLDHREEQNNEQDPNSVVHTNLNVVKEPACGPSEGPLLYEKHGQAQNWQLKAQADESEDPTVPKKTDTELNKEIFEMEIIKRKHLNDQDTTHEDLFLKNNSTRLDCMEKRTTHEKQKPVKTEKDVSVLTNMSPDLVEHQFEKMHQLDQDAMWKNKEVEQMKWDLWDCEQTNLAVTQVEQRTDQTERYTLFVVDKMFLATPNFTGLNTDILLDDQELDITADNMTEQVEGNSKEQDFPAIPDMDPSEDAGFTIKIQAPGTESTDFQVSPLAMVQEIRQVLMDREETCRRTCFSLQLNGVTLDNFTHLRSIPGLQEGSVLKVVEEPYTVREVRIHLRHIRELLKSLDITEGYNGVEGSSPSFLSYFIEDRTEESSRPKRRSDGLKYAACSPPDHILPGCKERLLVPLHPQTNLGKVG